ncbi:hypothetical protein GDO81_020711 [Engystomops pustulosus]|uniref:Uncharacterized protein n=1 Tax=Engystomops pustulosus TaxID=76066 RepID=A0AAV6ZSK8_ENGPU|nr:hypothetical protein GDO81_020711 [Engystomops pustulosus]
MGSLSSIPKCYTRAPVNNMSFIILLSCFSEEPFVLRRLQNPVMTSASPGNVLPRCKFLSQNQISSPIYNLVLGQFVSKLLLCCTNFLECSTSFSDMELSFIIYTRIYCLHLHNFALSFGEKINKFYRNLHEIKRF